MKMNDKVYDIMKYAALIVLPATATLYTALAGIWNLPYAEQIPATIVAVDTFLGAVLMISNSRYKKLQSGSENGGGAV